MKVALVVHGRFWTFSLARALAARGHAVTLFTNYPKWAAARFGLPTALVRSFWPHAVASRLAWALRERGGLPYPEGLLHRTFGRWAAAGIARERWDVVYALSGVAEESFRIAPPGTLRVLARGSSHIRAQARILADEERRTGTRLDRPSRWMIGREEREYGLADRIVTLSTFARQTFEAEGEPAAKLWLLPPAADVATFHPPPELVAARCRRILGGEPLRVLNVGALSLRKGLWDMRAIIAGLPDGRFEFRFVGPVTREATGLVRALRGAAAFVPKQPEAGLPAAYGWGDVFVLPTIEDGFAVVLSQAAASALPILTTPNGAGADLVREGETGWVLPIRSPAAFVERLAWCDAHRVEVASMVQAAHRAPRSHDWSQVAGDFEARCRAHRTADPVSGRAETRA